GSSLGGSSASGGGGAERNYTGMSVFEGGIEHRLPPMPSGRLRDARTPPAVPTLFIRAEATVVGSTRVAWVASIQCRRIGSDDGRLATDLGRAIGSALGKRVQNGSV